MARSGGSLDAASGPPYHLRTPCCTVGGCCVTASQFQLGPSDPLRVSEKPGNMACEKLRRRFSAPLSLSLSLPPPLSLSLGFISRETDDRDERLNPGGHDKFYDARRPEWVTYLFIYLLHFLLQLSLSNRGGKETAAVVSTRLRGQRSGKSSQLVLVANGSAQLFSLPPSFLSAHGFPSISPLR